MKKGLIKLMSETKFNAEQEERFKEIFHEMPVVVQKNESEKYLHEIASELKRIRQTLERRR